MQYAEDHDVMISQHDKHRPHMTRFTQEMRMLPQPMLSANITCPH